WQPSYWSAPIDTNHAHAEMNHLENLELAVFEADRRKVWTAHLPSQVWIGKRTELEMTYRAKGLNSSIRNYTLWIDDGQGSLGGGVTPVLQSDLVSDGNVRTIRRPLGDHAPGLFGRQIALAIASGSTEAAFELIDLRLVNVDEIGSIQIVSAESQSAGAGVSKIEGRVVDSSNHPVESAIVQLDRSFPQVDPGHVAVLTDRLGRWEIPLEDAQHGAIRVKVHHSEYVAGTATVTPGVTSTIELDPGFTVFGSVVDQFGELIPNPTIYVLNGDTHCACNIAETDAGGFFWVDQVNASGLELRAHAPGYAAKTISWQPDDELEVQLDPAYPLTVRVTNAEGEPVQDALVSVQWRAGIKDPWWARTGPDGIAVWVRWPGTKVFLTIETPDGNHTMEYQVQSSFEASQITVQVAESAPIVSAGSSLVSQGTEP
ncbi:MAG: carboxypeptidase-like regulatory domain-containing protein, partial [Planctomycetota bacterium]